MGRKGKQKEYLIPKDKSTEYLTQLFNQYPDDTLISIGYLGLYNLCWIYSIECQLLLEKGPNYTLKNN